MPDNSHWPLEKFLAARARDAGQRMAEEMTAYINRETAKRQARNAVRDALEQTAETPPLDSNEKPFKLPPTIGRIR